jgi:hypothetical protein
MRTCQSTGDITHFQDRLMAMTHKMSGFHLMGFSLMGKNNVSLLSTVQTQTDCPFISKCSKFFQFTPKVYPIVYHLLH